MSTWLIIVVTIIYGATALSLLLENKMGHSIMFASYAAANVGIILAMRGI
jgi:hypothetical protein